MQTPRHFTDSLHQLGDSFAEGWHHLSDNAAHALTHFRHAARGNSNEDGTAVSIHRGKSVPPAASRSWGVLASDLQENGRGYRLRMELPGLNAQDIDVCVDNGELVVSGVKHGRHDDSDGEFLFSECAYGHFQRRYPLRREVASSKAEAHYRDGVLELWLPKVAISEPRLVPVNPG